MITPGTVILFNKYLPKYLNSRYARIKIRSRWHPTRGPIRCVGMSLFDYFMELKGDQGQFRSSRASNPSDVQRGSEAAGIVHECLDGSQRFEQRFGPKRNAHYEWPAVYADFHEFLEPWIGGGIIGMVDETGRYLQGRISGLNWKPLRRASVPSFRQESVSFNFQEV